MRMDLRKNMYFINRRRNTLIGRLKLQSCEKANIFYSGELYAEDSNLAFGDFSSPGFGRLYPFTQQGLMESQPVKVDADTTIVQGMFEDQLGELAGKNIEYVVNIYLWIEAEDTCKGKEDKNDDQSCA